LTTLHLPLQERGRDVYEKEEEHSHLETGGGEKKKEEKKGGVLHSSQENAPPFFSFSPRRGEGEWNRGGEE